MDEVVFQEVVKEERLSEAEAVLLRLAITLRGDSL